MTNLPYAYSLTKTFMAALAKNPLLVSWLPLVYASILCSKTRKVDLPQGNPPFFVPSVNCLMTNLPYGDHNEFDLFFLLDDKVPLLIECQSGDHRAYLQKSADLRKRLKLDKTHFLLLVAGLEQEKVAGMSATFDVTVANEVNAVFTVLKLLGAA